MVAKVEIACFEQFLLLSPCFQKSSASEVSESVFMWERVNTGFLLGVQGCEDKHYDWHTGVMIKVPAILVV